MFKIPYGGSRPPYISNQKVSSRKSQINIEMAERYSSSSNKPDIIVIIDDEKKQEKTKSTIVIDEDEEADELEKDWSLMVEEDGIKLKFEEYNGAQYYVEDDEDDDVEKLWWLRDYDADDEDDEDY